MANRYSHNTIRHNKNQIRGEGHRRNIEEQARSRVVTPKGSLDSSGKTAITTSLRELIGDDDPTSIKIFDKHTPLNITSPYLQTSLDYTTYNIPKSADINYNKVNFSFGSSTAEAKENFEEMVSTPKTIIDYIEYEQKNNHISRFFLVAPFISKDNLPILYRMDILKKIGDEEFYGIKLSAIVGGFVDGDCPLTRIIKESAAMARLYNVKSGCTYHSINIDYDVEDNNRNNTVEYLPDIYNINDALKLALDRFGVKNRYLKDQTNTVNIHKLIASLQKDKFAKVLTRDVDAQMIFEEFLNKEENLKEGIGSQYVYKDGVMQPSFTVSPREQKKE